MARKDLLKNLMGDNKQNNNNDLKENSTDISGASPRTNMRSSRAIGAVSQSISDLQSRAIQEIDTSLIDAAGLEDRLPEDENDIIDLAQSIQEYGQQVPVLLRPNPEAKGRFQIVYGRRRVQAVQRLNQPIKAMIRDMDDRDLVVAQGQENTARKDLSFIEKARFAAQMEAAGYARKVIGAALHIDKTVISRMLSVIERVPEQWIIEIGPAPTVGRDRWLEFAERIEAEGAYHDELRFKDPALPSDHRFAKAFHSLAPRPAAKAGAKRDMASDKLVLKTLTGAPLGQAARTTTRFTLSFDRQKSQGFEDWLLDNLAEIHRDWEQSQRDDRAQTPAPSNTSNTKTGGTSLTQENKAPESYPPRALI